MPVLTNVIEHRHCEICQRAIPLGDRLCGSDECKAKWDEALRAKKRGMYMLIGVILLAMLFGVVSRGF